MVAFNIPVHTSFLSAAHWVQRKEEPWKFNYKHLICETHYVLYTGALSNV